MTLVSTKGIRSPSQPLAHSSAWTADGAAVAAAGGMSKCAALALVQSLGAQRS